MRCSATGQASSSRTTLDDMSSTSATRLATSTSLEQLDNDYGIAKLLQEAWNAEGDSQMMVDDLDVAMRVEAEWNDAKEEHVQGAEVSGLQLFASRPVIDMELSRLLPHKRSCQTRSCRYVTNHMFRTCS